MELANRCSISTQGKRQIRALVNFVIPYQAQSKSWAVWKRVLYDVSLDCNECGELYFTVLQPKNSERDELVNYIIL
jgi:hypothetical protein